MQRNHLFSGEYNRSLMHVGGILEMSLLRLFFEQRWNTRKQYQSVVVIYNFIYLFIYLFHETPFVLKFWFPLIYIFSRGNPSCSIKKRKTADLVELSRSKWWKSRNSIYRTVIRKLEIVSVKINEVKNIRNQGNLAREVPIRFSFSFFMNLIRKEKSNFTKRSSSRPIRLWQFKMSYAIMPSEHALTID